jgi:predicted lipase
MWDYLLPIDGAYAAIKRLDDTDYVMFRGSTTFMDWRQDFEDFALPYDDPVLGPLHPGFREGALMVKDEIDRLVQDKIVVVGHSLGAGHAVLYAGYRVAEERGVDGLVLFGEPKSGGPQLAERLAHIPISSYRNANTSGHDLVTDVPFTDMPRLPYCHVRALTDCRADPDPLDPWLIFKYHHFKLYARAFGCGGKAALSLST